MNQERRRALHGNLKLALANVEQLYLATVGAVEATRLQVQRAVILPGIGGHSPRFRIGTAEGGPVTEVAASMQIDVYLERYEPCPDCGGQLQAGTEQGPEYEAGDLVCARCGSLFSQDPARWLDRARETYCTDCQLAVETVDGGPALCFRCRSRQGVLTICSGCGRPYEATSTRTGGAGGEGPQARPGSPWSRLCERCDHPATVSPTRPTSEAVARYHAVASVYGTPGQVQTALETATALQAPGVPTRMHDQAELWSASEMEAVTRWLQDNLEQEQ